MGYPMTYRRVVHRNHLHGDYRSYLLPGAKVLADCTVMLPDGTYQNDDAIAGDLRRLERDQRDESHLRQYAEKAGITPDQARAVLDAFFDGDF